MKYLATIKKIYDSEDFEDKYKGEADALYAKEGGKSVDDPDNSFTSLQEVWNEDLVMELFGNDISYGNFKIEIEPLEVE